MRYLDWAAQYALEESLDRSVPTPIDDRPRPENDPEVLRLALVAFVDRCPYRWVQLPGFGELRCFYCERCRLEEHADDCAWKIARRLVRP